MAPLWQKKEKELKRELVQGGKKSVEQKRNELLAALRGKE